MYVIIAKGSSKMGNGAPVAEARVARIKQAIPERSWMACRGTKALSVDGYRMRRSLLVWTKSPEAAAATVPEARALSR